VTTDDTPIIQAAHELAEHFGHPDCPWLQTIGVREEQREIVVYMISMPPHDVIKPRMWQGFSVKYMKVGRIRMASKTEKWT
jgi:hypothetical protein